MSEDFHTNQYIKMQKNKRKRISDKSQAAVDAGDIEAVVDSLTTKMLAFCEEYTKDLNGSAAVLRAGYKTQNPNRVAYQLMENPAIRLTIDKLRAERNKNSDVTKDFVLRGIQKAIRLAEESNNLQALLRGYELLGKHLSLFVDRQEISGPDGEAIKMEQKLKEDVADFRSSILGLASRSGEGSPSK